MPVSVVSPPAISAHLAHHNSGSGGGGGGGQGGEGLIQNFSEEVQMCLWLQFAFFLLKLYVGLGTVVVLKCPPHSN